MQPHPCSSPVESLEAPSTDCHRCSGMCETLPPLQVLEGHCNGRHPLLSMLLDQACDRAEHEARSPDESFNPKTAPRSEIG